MQPITVRQVTPEDLPRILKIEQLVEGEHAATLGTLQRRQAMFPEGFLCALKGNEIIGYAQSCIWHRPHFTKFSDIENFEALHNPGASNWYNIFAAVHPSHRGQGAYRALMQQRFVRARNLGLQTMDVVDITNKAHIRQFHLSMGYVTVRDLPGFAYGANGSLLEKDLTEET